MTAAVRRALSSNLQTRLAGQILIHVKERGYAPGALISENALAQTFGVSRTPVRGALAVLSKRGLLNVVPRRGYVLKRAIRDQDLEPYSDLASEDDKLVQQMASDRFSGALPDNVTETELMRRYDETRRLHPLAPDRPAEDGIARERDSTAPLRNAADSVLDTTDLRPVELRDELRRRYGGDVDQPVITVASFAFARGISRTADLVFDLRFLPNPHWVDELRPLTGKDQAVRDYLAEDPAWAETMDRIEALLNDWIPRYWAAGKSYVTVAFGCTGGRHRSVAAATEMAERLERSGFAPNVRHRDLSSPPSDSIERHPGRHSEAGELNE